MDGELLKYSLHRKGKTVEELAKFLGISRQMVTARINGRANWTLNEIKSVANFMKLDNAELMAIFFSE